jgi:hypothetical protein
VTIYAMDDSCLHKGVGDRKARPQGCHVPDPRLAHRRHNRKHRELCRVRCRLIEDADELLLRIAVFAAVGIASGFIAGLFSIGGGIVRNFAQARNSDCIGNRLGGRNGRHCRSHRFRIGRTWLPACSLGYLNLIVWVTMVPTVMVAALFGVRLGHELNKTWLNRLLIELLFVVGVDMTIKVFP